MPEFCYHCVYIHSDYYPRGAQYKQCENNYDKNSETFLEKPPTHTVSHLPTCIYWQTWHTQFVMYQSCLSTIHAVLHKLWITNFTEAKQFLARSGLQLRLIYLFIFCNIQEMVHQLQPATHNNHHDHQKHTHKITIEPVSHVKCNKACIDCVLVSYAVGLDKRMLTLILSRQGHISSAPCHQSSEPSASGRVACLYSINHVCPPWRVMSRMLGCFYRKKRAILEAKKSSIPLYMIFTFCFHWLPAQHNCQLRQHTPISYDLHQFWLSHVIFLNVNVDRLTRKAVLLSPRIKRFCCFPLTAPICTDICWCIHIILMPSFVTWGTQVTPRTPVSFQAKIFLLWVYNDIANTVIRLTNNYQGWWVDDWIQAHSIFCVYWWKCSLISCLCHINESKKLKTSAKQMPYVVK